MTRAGQDRARALIHAIKPAYSQNLDYLASLYPTGLHQKERVTYPPYRGLRLHQPEKVGNREGYRQLDNS